MEYKTDVKRNYKDTVFRMLFKTPENALSLYNGLTGSDYKNVSELEFNTLENAIFMGMKNDISFIIRDDVNLYEQQSTWEPNMPLRNLFYISDVYQRYVKEVDKSIYGYTLIKLHNAKFVVFYNGKEKHQEYCELKLSDAYFEKDSDVGLELVVKVYNINEGYNEDLKRRCPLLGEYMKYVDTVRKYAKEYELNEAVTKAVDECIENGILRNFLMRQKSEVIKMSIYEYDEEEEKNKIRRDAENYFYEEGIAKGKEEGKKEGIESGIISLVETLRELSVSDEIILDKLMEKFDLSREKAEKYLAVNK